MLCNRSKFKFSSVPVFNHKRKFGIANSVVSDHVCDNKRFNIRYVSFDNNEYSRQINFCAHEVAGYLSIVDYYKNEKYSITPYEMNQFAIPSQETVNFYDKLCNNCLIDDDKLRKLNKAEKEILLWGLVSKQGSDAFKPTGKLKDYNW